MKALLLAGSAAAAMLVASPQANAEHYYNGHGQGGVHVDVQYRSGGSGYYGGGYYGGGGYRGGSHYGGGYYSGPSHCQPVYRPPVCSTPVYRPPVYHCPPAPRVIYYSQPTYYGGPCRSW